MAVSKELYRLTTRINAAVDWFIPEELRSARDLVQGVRMFLFSHLFGPFLGHTISLSMLYLQGGADTSWWIFFFAVTAFWPFPWVLRFTGWYVPLALLSIENLLFCIFWGCYQYGGASSPIMPWLVTVPLLAFFYLPGRATRIVVGLQIVVNLAIFYAIYDTIGFPNKIAPTGLVALGLVSTFCAGIYVSMMALYYGNVVSSQAELEDEIKRHQETERQLIHATEKIERAMLAKSEFLAKMSHELRNPLNSIIGYSEVLLDGIDSSNRQTQNDLSSIREAGHRLLELINDLLDMSKLEAGRMELHTDCFWFDEFMEAVIAKWRSHIEQNGNKLVVAVAPALGMQCDAQKLERIVANVLSNAGKFTKEGEVLVSSSATADTVTITIADNGPGIQPAQVATLFETFGSTGEETSSNYGADVRLGLPLAYRFCRLIGGDLFVTSEVGRGATFTVTIPLRPVEQEGADGRPKLAEAA
jgi:signal transduction histidine kinase